MTVGLLLFYDSGPVVVLRQWVSCCSTGVVLFMFYGNGPVVGQ